MNPSKQLHLILFASSIAIGSSCEITTVTSHRNNNLEDRTPPFKLRGLYQTETIELNQDPCNDIPVAVEQITDEPTYYPTSPPTSPPSAKPSVSPTTMEPVPEIITTTSSTTTTTTATTTEEVSYLVGEKKLSWQVTPPLGRMWIGTYTLPLYLLHLCITASSGWWLLCLE